MLKKIVEARIAISGCDIRCNENETLGNFHPSSDRALAFHHHLMEKKISVVFPKIVHARVNAHVWTIVYLFFFSLSLFRSYSPSLNRAAPQRSASVYKACDETNYQNLVKRQSNQTRTYLSVALTKTFETV